MQERTALRYVVPEPYFMLCLALRISAVHVVIETPPSSTGALAMLQIQTRASRDADPPALATRAGP
jgi:hypothetical protein